MSCCVAICGNYHRKTYKTNPAIIYHRFPTDKTLQKIWLNRTKRADSFNIKNARVCSIHFKESDYYNQTHRNKTIKILNANALPSLNLGYIPSEIISSSAKKAKIETDPFQESKIPESSESTLENKHFQLNSADSKTQETPLKSEINELKAQIPQLKQDVEESKIQFRDFKLNLITKLIGLLSPKQVDILGGSKKYKCIKWTTDEIISAIDLHSKSSKLFKSLRKKSAFAQPCNNL